MSNMNREIFLRILGEPASKANSRRLIMRGRKPMMIKSEKALNYADYFRSQIQELDELLDGDLAIHITIYYASRRPDLDESLILDLLQGKVYLNDRQIKEKHIYHRLDKENPRSEIRIHPIQV
jgi:hypothetical protein